MVHLPRSENITGSNDSQNCKTLNNTPSISRWYSNFLNYQFKSSTAQKNKNMSQKPIWLG